jgi:hypothetical protein
VAPLQQEFLQDLPSCQFSCENVQRAFTHYVMSMDGVMAIQTALCPDPGGKHLLPVPTGQDSSVGIVIRYGLDGPGIESLWGRDFPHPSRPALGPTQPTIQWVPGPSRG